MGINIGKLIGELQAAGIKIEGAAVITGTKQIGIWNSYSHDDDIVRVDFPSGLTDESIFKTVAAIVAAHDPTDTEALALAEKIAETKAAAADNPLQSKSLLEALTMLDDVKDFDTMREFLRHMLKTLYLTSVIQETKADNAAVAVSESALSR